jgi:capsule polysaccharide export protein KpsE/RkpR
MKTIPEHDLREMIDGQNLGEVARANDDESVGRARTAARLRLLWDERRFVFRISIYGLALFTLVAFLIPKLFESSAVLMPPDDQSSSGMMLAATLASKVSGSLAGMAGDVLGLKSSGDLFIGILRSRTVQDDLIKKFDLRKEYGTRQWDQTRRILTARTTISEDRKSGIITITVTDKTPERAAAIAGEYVAELNTVVSQLSTSSAHRERVFLEERLAQVKLDLESAEKDFSQFASKNGAIDIKEQGRAMVASAASLEGQLIAAQSELQGLKQIYSENNVRVRSLKARISELQNQLQQLSGKQEIAGDATNSENGDLYPSIRKLPLLGVPYADLYRRTRVQEAVFESLTQEYELAKVAEAKEIPSVRVLDPPNVPERKSFPPRLIIMALGMIFSFASAVLWVVGKCRWHEIEPDAPHKILAQEMFTTFNRHMPWATPNGSRFQAKSHKVWMMIKPRNGAAENGESLRPSG